MHVTIGGQKIAIKTKPSDAATPDTPLASPAVSPMMGGRKTPQPQEESDQDSDEAKEEESVNENVNAEVSVDQSDNVMDLLADFTLTPAASVDPTPAGSAPTGINSDILDLLGGIEDCDTQPSPSPTPVQLQGSIGNVSVVGYHSFVVLLL